MANLQLLKFTLVGSSLKALFADPSINTQETITFIEGVGGSSSLDDVRLQGVSFSQCPSAGTPIGITVYPLASNFNSDSESSYTRNWYSSNASMPNGDLILNIQMYEEGKVLNDIPDEWTMDIYLNVAIATDITP